MMTCDGTSPNLYTVRVLGCTFTPDYDNKSVISPSHRRSLSTLPCLILVTWLNLYGILWVILGSLGIMKTIIDWSFLRRLVQLQNEKMKANFRQFKHSFSVANALELLKDDLKLQEFQGCGPRIQFVRKRLFIIMNSRNPYGKGFQSPLKHQIFPKQNQFSWKKVNIFHHFLTNEN